MNNRIMVGIRTKMLLCTVLLGWPPRLPAAAESPAGTRDREAERIKEAIVKVFAVQNPPDYYEPWSMRGMRSVSGSGCLIRKRRILTNAHVISDRTFILVRRFGQTRKFRAGVLAVSHEADLALLTVADDEFWEGVRPLEVGFLPDPHTEIAVYGFPLGGDYLSVTKGVISRIEHRTYTHSSCFLLAAQIDAAINPGNSGGPAVADGKVVGVVMQGMPSAENIGYIVPSPVIRHFLQDVRDGTYDGFPSLGLVLQETENRDMKRYFGMPPEGEGVLVLKVAPGSPADGVIRPGDILLEVDGCPVAEDGTVEFQHHQRTSVAYCIQRHQIGDTIPVKLWRKGERIEVEVVLSRPMQDDWLIPNQRYDVLPTYYIYGGLVFMPLTRNYLMSWGPNWFNNAPKELVAMLSDNLRRPERDEVVLMTKVLASSVNEGYHKWNNWVVEKVNGVPVRNLRHLVELVEGSRQMFVVFENDKRQKIILDRSKAIEATPEILKTYHIPADRSPDLRKPGLTEVSARDAAAEGVEGGEG
ncbi:MAG TPA: serine protease [Kiritimatiellae bacterium]|nr:serine protease [Kiritimatiellia bacterium]